MEAVVRVLPQANFSLELWFNTGDHRWFDVRPYLEKGGGFKSEVQHLQTP